MMAPYAYLRFHATDPDADAEVRGLAAAVGIGADFDDDEQAARAYLAQYLGASAPGVRGAAALDVSANEPHLIDRHPGPSEETRLVRFTQVVDGVEVFGSRLTVELTAGRGLFSIDASVAPGVPVSGSHLQDRTVRESLRSTPRVVGDAVAADIPTALKIFRYSENDPWRLAFVFENVSVEAQPGLLDHGMAPSPRTLEPHEDIVLDAESGHVLARWSSTPQLVEVPTFSNGLDERNAARSFWTVGRNGAFVMVDPVRSVATSDLQYADIESGVPTSFVSSASPAFAASNRAAVSAQANATVIMEFLHSVLHRNGVNNAGLELHSIVNCTLGGSATPPVWRNAVWNEDRMWFGQDQSDPSRIVSLARFLDVTAHEVMHGITKSTAGLVYLDESGALNESLSDIFGIIVSNWDQTAPATGGSINTWDWRIGNGFATDGGPLRDVRDPDSRKQPIHMTGYLHTGDDNGGVHTNSGIHNRAAYLLLAAEDAGQPVFSPIEVAYLYYFALMNLPSISGFRDVLVRLQNVVRTVNAGDEPRIAQRLERISSVYAQVGVFE